MAYLLELVLAESPISDPKLLPEPKFLPDEDDAGRDRARVVAEMIRFRAALVGTLGEQAVGMQKLSTEYRLMRKKLQPGWTASREALQDFNQGYKAAANRLELGIDDVAIAMHLIKKAPRFIRGLPVILPDDHYLPVGSANYYITEHGAIVQARFRVMHASLGRLQTLRAPTQQELEKFTATTSTDWR